MGKFKPNVSVLCRDRIHNFVVTVTKMFYLLDRYRENAVIHQSVLSSLSASYNGVCDLSYYEDLPNMLDTNLSDVDVENFRTDEDINLLLNSICKSKQLFSPVKESVLSIDSLDMDCYAEEDCDMILTCQANKNNYTIAFEGSTLYTDSFYGTLSLDL